MPMKTSSKNSEDQGECSQRLDRWLWVARFFKTRKLASDAISAGHVRLNDRKSRPGKTVKVGDQLTINKNHQQFCITIIGFSQQRLSAPGAKDLYQEPQWSIDRRENEQLLRKHSNQGVRYDRSRPNQRDRKKTRDIKQQIPEDN